MVVISTISDIKKAESLYEKYKNKVLDEDGNKKSPKERYKC